MIVTARSSREPFDDFLRARTGQPVVAPAVAAPQPADGAGSAPLADLVAASAFAPTETVEAAVLLVLPPGPYTSVVSGVDGGTGIALAEAYELEW